MAYVQRSAAAVTPVADVAREPRAELAETSPSSSASATVGTDSQPGLQPGAEDHTDSAAGRLDAAGASAGANSPQQSRSAANLTVAATDQPEQLAWFRISNQHVKRVTWAQVLAAEAYLLLYAQVQ